MRFPLPLVLLFPAAAMAAPQTTTAPPTTVTPARIDVKVAGTLSEVLDRISRQTGMKVTYEGGTPRTRVSPNLTGVTPAQAVVGVMEGLDLNYLMGLDATSNRVETLLVVSRGSGGSRPSLARSATTAPRMQPQDDAMPEDEPAEEDPMAGAVMEAIPADPTDPMGLGGQPPPGSGPGANQNVEPNRGGDQKPLPPQPFHAPPPPPGIGWSAPPGTQFGPPPGVVPPGPQPGATPPPNQQ